MDGLPPGPGSQGGHAAHSGARAGVTALWLGAPADGRAEAPRQARLVGFHLSSLWGE